MRHNRLSFVRSISTLTAVSALVVAAALPAAADETEDSPGPSGLSLQSDGATAPESIDVDEVIDKALETPGHTGKWFVELSAKPTIEGGNASTISAQQESFENEVAATDVEVQENFVELWNGVTVTAQGEELRTIAEMDDVVALFPVVEVERPVTTPGDMSSPDQIHANDMTGATTAHDDGATGAGIKIGIIDSGIDIDNTVFGGSGVSDTTSFPNAKVVAGYDFVGDAFNADSTMPSYNPVPTPDANPDDCGGHGTHVAGIAAGNDTESEFKGVAPDALLGAYRVFGCEGSTDSDVMLQAMERAAADGMDVVNMSIGAAGMTWPNYPTAVAADNLAASGVVVVVSQGNSGERGVFYGGAPGVAPGVITVGSVDNTHIQQFAFSVNGQLHGYIQAAAAATAAQEGELELATYPAGQETGAVDLPGEPFTGKAVLVFRGDSSFHDKAIAAQRDGAAAVVIANNVTGTISASVQGADPITIPVVTITQEDGLAVQAAITGASEESPATLVWTSQTAVSEDPVGGEISTFSSWGVAADLSLKPDVLAPGGNIFSSYPLDAVDGNGSGFAANSGTSMASPHVAGSAALLLGANPGLNPQDVRVLLQNNAEPVGNHKTPLGGQIFPEAVFLQGAGLINIPNSLAKATSGAPLGTVAAPSTVSPSKIDLRDADAIETTNLTITNNAPYEVSYELSVDDSPLTVYGRNVEANQKTQIPINVSDVTQMSLDHVSVPAKSSRTIQIRIDDPAEYWSGDSVPGGTMYGGYIVFQGSDNTVQRVPFFGMTGDYERDRNFLLANWMDISGYTAEQLVAIGYDPYAPAMPPAIFYLTSAGSYSRAQANRTFTMDGGDLPGIGVATENPMQNLTVNIFHANEDGTKGELLSEFAPLYHSDGRPATSAYTIIALWDGTYQASADPADIREAPNGRYMLEASGTRGVGAAANGENTDTWVTQPFIVREIPVDPEPEGPAADLHNDWTSTVAATIQPLLEGTVLVGDWDGDGTDTLGFRSGNVFTYANAADLSDAASFTFGRADDVALVGDWDGDGTDTVGVRRGTTFHLSNSLQGGNADASFFFGQTSDVALVGDWDGDGTDTVGVRRGTTFHLKNSLQGGNADATVPFGRADDVALVGDWDGDGTDTVGVRRGDSVFLKNTISGGTADETRKFASADSILIFGDWDGNGTDTPGVLR